MKLDIIDNSLDVAAIQRVRQLGRICAEMAFWRVEGAFGYLSIPFFDVDMQVHDYKGVTYCVSIILKPRQNVL